MPEISPFLDSPPIFAEYNERISRHLFVPNPDAEPLLLEGSKRVLVRHVVAGEYCPDPETV